MQVAHSHVSVPDANGLGKPDMHDSEEKYEYWGWHIQPNDEYSFAVYVNTSPELFVERVAQ